MTRGPEELHDSTDMQLHPSPLHIFFDRKSNLQGERLEKGMKVQSAHPVGFVDTRELFAAYYDFRDFELPCFIWSFTDDHR